MARVDGRRVPFTPASGSLSCCCDCLAAHHQIHSRKGATRPKKALSKATVNNIIHSAQHHCIKPIVISFCIP